MFHRFNNTFLDDGDRVWSAKGFTLIEILVALALLGVLVNTLVSHLLSARKTSAANAAALEVQSAIQYVEVLGRGGTQADGVNVDSYDLGYGVLFVEGSNSIIIYKGSGTTTAHSKYDGTPSNIIETINLPGGAFISSVCSFVPLDAGDNYDCADAEAIANDKLHLHSRRGEHAFSLFNEDEADIYLKGEIEVTVGAESRVIEINSTGLVYVLDN